MELDQYELDELLRGLSLRVREMGESIHKDLTYIEEKPSNKNKLLIDACHKDLGQLSDLYSKLYTRMMQVTD